MVARMSKSKLRLNFMPEIPFVCTHQAIDYQSNLELRRLSGPTLAQSIVNQHSISPYMPRVSFHINHASSQVKASSKTSNYKYRSLTCPSPLP